MKVIEPIRIKSDIKKVFIRPLFYLSSLVLTGCNTGGRSMIGENSGLVHRSSAPSVVAVASSSSSGDDISSAPSVVAVASSSTADGSTNFIGRALRRAANVPNYLKFITISSFGLFPSIVCVRPTFMPYLKKHLPSYISLMSSDLENLRNECGRICGNYSAKNGYSTNKISSLCSSITSKAFELYHEDFKSNYERDRDKYAPTLEETENLESEVTAYIKRALQRNNYTDCLPSFSAAGLPIGYVLAAGAVVGGAVVVGVVAYSEFVKRKRNSNVAVDDSDDSTDVACEGVSISIVNNTTCP